MKRLNFKLVKQTNPRNGPNEGIIIFDEMLFGQRYTIEKTKSIDSYSVEL